jgi:transcriptional regulator with XRE-family HTH domain
MNTERNSQRRRPYGSLRAWRASQGLSQPEAAAYLAISQGYYCKLERRIAAPRPAIAKRVTELTGVPLEVLLGIAA